MEHTSSYYCPCCKNHVAQFIPWPAGFFEPESFQLENWNPETGICSMCRALDRERLYTWFIERETDLFMAQAFVFHIDPEKEKHVKNKLAEYSNLHYVSGEFKPLDPWTKGLDVTNLYYKDHSFDVIICSHILDNISEDRKAMSELYRVMKVGGWGIMQVPLAINIGTSLEDEQRITPEDRARVYGHPDHVRVYAKEDYIKRLESVGFRVELYNIAKRYSFEEAHRLGLSKEDNLYIVHKDA
ncbi:methyltransferase domain-containing protein [Thermoactinomyces sp. DSM 45892]|uniref:methyltransferase domain-containing protein n=1 Tax=Thermoactinomyces sp. DSM 45892 TaxID=1882753 RepID=UPI000B86C191|nr:methyltransferase domain-containing protein [Thermoactinomyces sp. DSM 45892]